MEQRACKPCARAKRRCDKQEPQCARCRRRGIGCIYPPAKQTSFVLCREDDASTSTFSAHEIVPNHSPVSDNNIFGDSEELTTWNLGFVTLPVSRSVDKEQLVCYIAMMREWLVQWVEQGSNPFIHASLYRTRMPPCVQDAYTTLSCYLHKKPSNEQTIFRILEDRAGKLLATKGSDSDKDYVSLNSVEHLARVQALLVYQILGLFDGDIRLRHFAESQMMPVLDTWVQEMVEHVAQVASPGGSVDLCAREQLYEYVDQDITNRDNLDWYSWIVAESIQRTWMMAAGIQAIYMMMQQDAAPPCLGYMVFTTRPGVWEAPSAVAWSKLCLEMNTGLIQMAEADRLFTEAVPEDVNEFTKVFLEATFGVERMERWAACARDQGYGFITNESRPRQSSGGFINPFNTRRAWISMPRMIATQAGTDNPAHKAYIALGSNLGDRVGMIEQACSEMNRAGIKVKRTSSLFETAPMYVLDQEPFLNAACEVETTLGPIELLDTLQAIENGMGRQKIIDKGPRNIDLDILLYDNETVSHPRLNIPHKLMLEREFVLRPLCQLIPHERVPLPGTNLSYISALRSLPPSEPVPVIISPLSPHIPPLTPSNPKKKTIVMAILNVTPDSFSDGGKHFFAHENFNPEDLTSTIREFIAAGATIIDVGGESTRPNATKLTEEEELARVIPVIKHIRSLPEAAHVAISIDTYRARVAEQACHAGADIINDVSAGTLDPDMLRTMASTGKSVILMHMRGDPSTMTKLTSYPNGIIQDVSTELLAQVHAAEEAGIPRWRIILDPGLGFAKKGNQNVSLLRGMSEFTSNNVEGLENYPWLVGTSRKAYIGHITGVEKADERVWGTAAAVTASVANGADIVRVHDVKEMGQVVRMADAIYRF